MDARTPEGEAPPAPVEVEWQFDALDLRPVARWIAEVLPHSPSQGAGRPLVATAKPARRMVDRYLDTADGRLNRACFTLRVRRQGRRSEATLKDTQPADGGGLRRRLEVTEPLPPGGIADLAPAGPVGRRIAAIAGSRPLHQVLEVRTRRQPFDVRAGTETVAEIALDDTTVVLAEGRPVRLHRVEVEVVPAWGDALVPFVASLRTAGGLRPATLSKYEAGLLAAGRDLPGIPDLGPTHATSTSTTADLAYAVLRRNLAALMQHEPGTRLGEDPEELHDMRVATRRLRAAFDLFADALPVYALALAPHLAWMTGVLGAVRDLDVQSAGLDALAAALPPPGTSSGTPGPDGRTGTPGPDTGAPEALRGENAGAPRVGHARGGARPDLRDEIRRAIDARRVVARRDLLGALDSERWDRAVASVVEMVRKGAPRRSPTARLAATAVLPELVLGRHRAAAKAARRARKTGSVADYHRLRIRAKRLRYSLEFTSDLYGQPTDRYVRRLARLQDGLGHMHDAQVAAAHLEDLATSGDNALSPATVFAMGRMAERSLSQVASSISGIDGRLADLDGPAWRRLSRSMDRARLAAASGRSAGRPGASRDVPGAAQDVPGAAQDGTGPLSAPDEAGPGHQAGEEEGQVDPHEVGGVAELGSTQAPGTESTVVPASAEPSQGGPRSVPCPPGEPVEQPTGRGGHRVLEEPSASTEAVTGAGSGAGAELVHQPAGLVLLHPPAVREVPAGPAVREEPAGPAVREEPAAPVAPETPDPGGA